MMTTAWRVNGLTQFTQLLRRLTLELLLCIRVDLLCLRYLLQNVLDDHSIVLPDITVTESDSDLLSKLF
jgi:hypothetical protein